VTNKAIARHLRLAADLIELTGGNAFRARAFGSAARTIERMDEPAAALAAEGSLTEVAGIGKGLADEIAALVETGRLGVVAEILAVLPPGLLDVLRVKGLGPKKVRVLWQELDVTSLDALEGAAVSGRIAALSGFGKKTQQNILEQVERLRTYAGKARYADVYDEVDALLRAVRALPAVARADVAGAFRRQMEVVEEIVVVAAGEAPALREALAHLGLRVETDGEVVARGHLPAGLPVRVLHAAPEGYGRTLWAATGSDQHVEQFVHHAGMPGAARDEVTIYAAAGLPFIPPPLREGDGEVEAAAKNALPRLLTVEDLKGSLHNHTTASDGTDTLEEMVRAARARGFEYLGVCDHSQSLKIASGLSVDRLLAQIEEIHTLNARLEAEGVRFRVLTGTECDILADGELDYPDEVLEKLDHVVASIHSLFKLGIAEQTRRLVRAVESGRVDIMGHLTGRLLLRRDGYRVDHEEVLAACAAHGVAVEVNANPYRLDLDWRWVRRAAEQGILISINPDAHSTGELDNDRWGVAVAQKGWLTPAQCLNAKSADDLLAWLRARRARS